MKTPESRFPLSHRFLDALQFAVEAHRSQSKGPRRLPFIYHPLGVASLVLQMGGDENQAVVALIHDTIEAFSRQEIADRFGPQIAERAFQFETPEVDPVDREHFARHANGDWRLARHTYQKHLWTLDSWQLLVVACEEIHEMLEWLRETRASEGQVWMNAPATASEYHWHYAEMGRAIESGLGKVYPLARDEYWRIWREFGRVTLRGNHAPSFS